MLYFCTSQYSCELLCSCVCIVTSFWTKAVHGQILNIKVESHKEATGFSRTTDDVVVRSACLICRRNGAQDNLYVKDKLTNKQSSLL